MTALSHISIVAFTGHRTYADNAHDTLRATIEELYRCGARTFRVGMAMGFDLAAGEAVVELQQRYSDVVIEAIIPWYGFADRFASCDRARYDAILRRATTIHYLASSYSIRLFHLRNDLLVRGADVLVAWYNGSKGGTEYTVRRARRSGVRCINLYSDGQLAINL